MVIMKGDKGSAMSLSVYLIHIEIGVRVNSFIAFQCACVNYEGVYITLYYLEEQIIILCLLLLVLLSQ